MAHLLWRGDFPAIVHPPKAARQQRDLYRQRMELVGRRSGAVARAKALADRLGFQAGMDLTTLSGLEDYAKLPMDPPHLPIRDSHVRWLTFLRAEIERLNDRIRCTAPEHPERQWLESIPGVGSYLALLIHSEVFDINRFPNSAHFLSYSGVAPGSFSSGGKVFAGRLCPNANKYLRWAFVETVHHYTAAAPGAKAKYDRLRRKTGWKTARLAIARHVARIAYHLLKEQRPYRPEPLSKAAG
jgi:transposase